MGARIDSILLTMTVRDRYDRRIPGNVTKSTVGPRLEPYLVGRAKTIRLAGHRLLEEQDRGLCIKRLAACEVRCPHQKLF